MTLDFGSGVQVTGPSTPGAFTSPLVVKFDATGQPLWARTVTAGPIRAMFDEVGLSPGGDIYAVGLAEGTGVYDFGAGVTVAAGSVEYNALIVKYNSAGVAQWARVPSPAPGESRFFGVTTDSTGSAYAVGRVDGDQPYDFGNGSIVVGGQAAYPSAAVVAFDPAGLSQWGAVVTGNDGSWFYDATVDGAGRLLVAGIQWGDSPYDCGNGVYAAGAAVGSSEAGAEYTMFQAVAAYGTDRIYTAGETRGSGVYDFGNGATCSGFAWGNNLVVGWQND